MSIPQKSYRESTSFEERKKRSNSLLLKYPDKIPVILEKSSKDKYLPVFDKTKLLVSSDQTVSNLINLLSQSIKIDEKTTIYLMANSSIMLSGSLSLESVYTTYKNLDGFLYIEYCTENVFG